MKNNKISNYFHSRINNTKLNKNITDSLIYAIGNYTFRFSSAATNIIVNNYLGPVMVGALTYLNAIDQNVDLLCQPVRSAVEREMPVLRSQDPDKAKSFAETAFSLSYLLMLFGSTFYFFVYLYSNNEYIKTAALFFIGINIIRSFSDLLRIYHAAFFNFKAIAISLVSISFFQPVVIIGLTYYFSMEGLLWGRIIIFSFAAFLLYHFIQDFPKVQLYLERKYIKAIYVIGFPLVLNSIISVLIVTVDKIFIQEYMGLKELGYYSIGSMVLQILLLFPNSIYGSYFPKFIAKTGDQKKVINLLTQLVSVSCAFIGAIAYLLLHPMFMYVLPKFIQGEQAAKILIFAFYFAGLYQMYYFELIRKNKIMKANVYLTFVFGISLLLFWGCVKFGLGIQSIAVVMVFSYFLLSVCIVSIALLEINETLRDITKTIMFSFVYIIPLVAVAVVDYVIKEYSLMSESIKVIALFSLFSIFAYYLLKNRELKSVLFHR